MSSDDMKIVRYDEYCSTCKFRDFTETDYPCAACLEIPARPNSERPEYWVHKS